MDKMFITSIAKYSCYWFPPYFMFMCFAQTRVCSVMVDVQIYVRVTPWLRSWRAHVLKMPRSTAPVPCVSVSESNVPILSDRNTTQQLKHVSVMSILTVQAYHISECRPVNSLMWTTSLCNQSLLNQSLLVLTDVSVNKMEQMQALFEAFRLSPWNEWEEYLINSRLNVKLLTGKGSFPPWH